DFLRQVLGERPVTPYEAEHVVVDRGLVGSQDERERTLVTSLRLPQYPEIRLGQRQGPRSIDGNAAICTHPKWANCRGFAPSSVKVFLARGKRSRSEPGHRARRRRGGSRPRR